MGGYGSEGTEELTGNSEIYEREKDRVTVEWAKIKKEEKWNERFGPKVTETEAAKIIYNFFTYNTISFSQLLLSFCWI